MEQESDEILVSKVPCWCGESSDACTVYLKDKPHLYCFSCGESCFKKDTVQEYLDDPPIPKHDQRQMRHNRKDTKKTVMAKFPLKGTILGLPDRGIDKKVAEFYGVATLKNKEGGTSCRVYPYDSPKKEVVAQKAKSLSKKITWLGNHKESVQLWGRTLFPAGGKFVTITEGEEDAMAAFQMLQPQIQSGGKPVVVSVKDGSSGAVKNCKAEYEWINSFDKVIIAFDPDEAGQKAARKVAELFPSKAHIILFDEGKDINEYLKEGRQKEFIDSWYRAEKHAPKGILSYNDLWKEMTRQDKFKTVPYPYEGLNEKLFGMHTGELVIWKAMPKIGKTAILSELAYHIHENSDYNVGIIFLEDTTKKIGLRMASLKANKMFHHPKTKYTMEELKEAHQYFADKNQFHFFDPSSERTIENVANKIKYFVMAEDVKFVFLDHISMLAYDAIEDNERRYLDKLISDLKKFTTEFDVGIQTVMHVNDEGKTRGTRASYQLCDALIHLERDKLNKDEVLANLTNVIVEENRICGDSGLACHLIFDKDTGRLTEADEEMIEELQKKKNEAIQEQYTRLREVEFDDDGDDDEISKTSNNNNNDHHGG